MTDLNFPDLIAQADRLRDSAQISQAIATYLDIAKLANDNRDSAWLAQSLHLAGLTAGEAVTGSPNSYFRDAFNYFSAAEKVYSDQKDSVGLGSLYRDMAKTATNAKDNNLAEKYFDQAVSTLTPTDNIGELAITYDKLGSYYSGLDQLDRAKTEMTKALELLTEEPTSGFYRATTLLDLARVNFKLNLLPEALDLATESLSWFEADHPGHSYTKRQAELYGLIGLIQAELNNKKLADQAFSRYQALLKTFDPLAIKAIEANLETLTK